MELDVADVILAFRANQFIYSLDETIYMKMTALDSAGGQGFQ